VSGPGTINTVTIDTTTTWPSFRFNEKYQNNQNEIAMNENLYPSKEKLSPFYYPLRKSPCATQRALYKGFSLDPGIIAL
jgi:hypothetical protein